MHAQLDSGQVTGLGYCTTFQLFALNRFWTAFEGHCWSLPSCTVKRSLWGLVLIIWPFEHEQKMLWFLYNYTHTAMPYSILKCNHFFLLMHGLLKLPKRLPGRVLLYGSVTQKLQSRMLGQVLLHNKQLMIIKTNTCFPQDNTGHLKTIIFGWHFNPNCERIYQSSWS